MKPTPEAERYCLERIYDAAAQKTVKESFRYIRQLERENEKLRRVKEALTQCLGRDLVIARTSNRSDELGFALKACEESEPGDSILVSRSTAKQLATELDAIAEEKGVHGIGQSILEGLGFGESEGGDDNT